jgi:hypothetical protein
MWKRKRQAMAIGTSVTMTQRNQAREGRRLMEELSEARGMPVTLYR